MKIYSNFYHFTVTIIFNNTENKVINVRPPPFQLIVMHIYKKSCYTKFIIFTLGRPSACWFLFLWKSTKNGTPHICTRMLWCQNTRIYKTDSLKIFVTVVRYRKILLTLCYANSTKYVNSKFIKHSHTTKQSLLKKVPKKKD